MCIRSQNSFNTYSSGASLPILYSFVCVTTPKGLFPLTGKRLEPPIQPFGHNSPKNFLCLNIALARKQMLKKCEQRDRPKKFKYLDIRKVNVQI